MEINVTLGDVDKLSRCGKQSRARYITYPTSPRRPEPSKLGFPGRNTSERTSTTSDTRCRTAAGPTLGGLADRESRSRLISAEVLGHNPHDTLVAVEHVARRTGVDDDLPAPGSRTSGTCVWPTTVTRASVPDARSRITSRRGRCRSPSSATRARHARPGTASPHSRWRRSIGSARSQSTRSSPSSSAPIRPRVDKSVGDLLHPERERRRPVEVGHRDVGIAGDDHRAERLPAWH